jgi:crotonobetainyl-CoA:carnitine CoA-transferase CaiB-like acyl-CoA transferase
MNDAQFKVLAHVIGRQDLPADARFSDNALRVANAAELDTAISEWTVQYTTRQAVELLEGAGVATAPIHTIAELLHDPHARWRGVVIPDGQSQSAGPFLRFSKTPLECPRPKARAIPSDADGWSGPPLSFFVPHPLNVDNEPRNSPTEGGLLTGVSIVELGAHTAGPLAGRLLAMLGADVVKVEPPKGEATRRLAQRIAGEGYLFHLNNTDKLGCTLNMDGAAGRADLMSLLKGADAFLTNISADTLGSWALRPESVVAACPQLVYCGLSGFGSDGPYGGRRAFDMVVQALSAIMSLTSRDEGGPRKIAISVVDVFAACSATIGTLAALFARSGSGRGQVVDVSLFDIAVWSTQDAWEAPTREQVDPATLRHADLIGGCLPTADGYMAIAAESPTVWSAFEMLVGRLAADPAATDGHGGTHATGAAAEVDVSIRARCLAGADLEAACWAQGIPAFVTRQLHEVAEAPHTRARALLTEVEYSNGTRVRVINSPFKFSRSVAAVRAAAPSLGQHNDVVGDRIRRINAANDADPQS